MSPAACKDAVGRRLRGVEGPKGVAIILSRAESAQQERSQHSRSTSPETVGEKIMELAAVAEPNRVGQRDADQPQQAATAGTADPGRTDWCLLRLTPQHKPLTIGQRDQPA